MQDLRYSELRDMLGADADHGIEERYQKLFEQSDFEEKMQIKKELEPKYVIVKYGGKYTFRAKWTDMHRSMLSSDEIRHGLCDGGGFWGVNGEKQLVTLYDSSSDFGFPKHIEEAIRQDGWRLLEILGKICDKSGKDHDLSGYKISYMDRQAFRHVINPPYNKQPESGVYEPLSSDTNERLMRLKAKDYKLFGRHSNYTPASNNNKKKRKAKYKTQKQSRRKNR